VLYYNDENLYIVYFIYLYKKKLLIPRWYIIEMKDYINDYDERVIKSDNNNEES